MKKYVFFTLLCLIISKSYAQEPEQEQELKQDTVRKQEQQPEQKQEQGYDYAKAFDWVIETFRMNDAGYQYIIEQKGEDDYNRFTGDLKTRTQNIKSDSAYVALVQKWLRYFRKGCWEFGLKGDLNHETENKLDSLVRKDTTKTFYISKLNNNTLYLHIPSFDYKNKAIIDSILIANDSIIRSIPNLIIDIRNSTGGSDASYEKLIPYLYTNPIRIDGIMLLGSELNAKGFDKYAQQTNNDYMGAIAAKLRNNIGKFISLGDNKSDILQIDSVLPYPRNIGIIISENNANTDEQFLLEAKQSKKVKLFGKTTAGAIDISNMTYISSPDNKYYLAYAISRSNRIPDYSIDDIGIQPDFYINSDIPQNEWVNYVQKILEE